MSEIYPPLIENTYRGEPILYEDDLFEVSVYNPSDSNYVSAKVKHLDLVNSFPMGTTELINEFDMASNSDKHVPTQRSVKQYVDNNINSGDQSNTPINILINGDVYHNNRTRKLLVVAQAYSNNDIRLRSYIGETSTSLIERHRSTILSDGYYQSRTSITFIVPVGYFYKVYVDNGDFGGVTSLTYSQAWEI